MKQLTATSKVLIALILIGSAGAAVYTRRDRLKLLLDNTSRPSAEAPTLPPSGGNTVSAPILPMGKSYHE